jgi:hypothetical protein
MSTDVLLLVIPAAALFILVVFIVFYIRRKLETAILPTIAASVLSLFIMGLMFIDVQRLKSQISGPTDKMSENIDEIFKEDSGRSKIRESTEKLNQLYDDTIKIEWGYWVSALALATCVFGSWQYKNEPPEGGMPKETAPPYKEGSTELS